MPDQPSAAAARTAPVVIFDLDGVFRQWNDEELDQVEEAFGLPPRTIITVAFSPELGPAAVTGRLTFPQWMAAIRERVIGEHGPDVAGAIDEWEANVGRVDTEMLQLLRAVRGTTTVALLSNGTTRLRRDLHVLDLLDEFDEVFNTAELGIAKPDPDVFRLVCSSLGVEPSDALFVDDLPENVEGARTAGLRAHVHVARTSTARFLAEHGVLAER
ncbi:HAD-IA family hydrolase [Dermatobacter hominis]|uniref:HAD-IA family hydrolase n=1 Tax=Dermatobacter hominis TaxID=2884263 RepID=UPI001D109B16|nr:HAD-IA family hydrolase [Dermatobacter hominis]UDY37274.1 HAD-IA family hydrolase [Dermatobacter hominis]